MVDYEKRPYAPRFPDQLNGHDNVPIPPHMPGYYSSLEDANFGGGDQLFDLECRLATCLSKELLSALEGPIQHPLPLPDFELNKVACLKNALLELKRENEALHQELWRVGRSKQGEEDRRKWSERLPPPPPLRPAGGPEPKGSSPRPSPSPRGSEPLRDVACQTVEEEAAAAPSFKGHDRSRESGPGSAKAQARPRPGKKHAQVSSHSKCVDWLKEKKTADRKCDRTPLVRLALWQLYELADRALTPRESSTAGDGDRCGDGTGTPEGNTEEVEGKEASCAAAGDGPGVASGEVEVEQLRLQLERLQRSTDRLRRRREQQAVLLRQKEIQVSRLQRSRTYLARTFKQQLLLLRQQQSIELKALQLQMQTERASSLAGQSTAMEAKLQNAVQQLEQRYRGLLQDAFQKKDSERNSRPVSFNGTHSRAESGT